MFLGATEEQMLLLSDAGVSHVSYVLILYSLAFLTFLCKSPSPSFSPFLSPSFSPFLSPSLSYSYSYSYSHAYNYPIKASTNTRLKVVHMLLHLYAVHEMPSLPIKLEDHHHHHNHNLSNGHARQHQHQQQDRVRDAEEFELEGLMSEDDSVDSPQAPHKRTEHVA
jgi:hypothetical protein